MEKTTPITNSKDLPSEYVDTVNLFLADVGVSASIPENYSSKGFYSDIIRNLLKADQVQRGRVSCIFSVHPIVGNYYGALHGGAVAAVSERVSIACARTVVAEDKELFLGELSMSYLSAAPLNEVLNVDASVVRSGRNLTVVATEIRTKTTGKLIRKDWEMLSFPQLCQQVCEVQRENKRRMKSSD